MTDDISGANYWAIDYLRLPPERIEEGRRATALNFCTSADAGLSKDWEAVFERVLAKLKGDAPQNVKPLRPALSIASDNSG
jgi:hypothetical protein